MTSPPHTHTFFLNADLTVNNFKKITKCFTNYDKSIGKCLVNISHYACFAT